LGGRIPFNESRSYYLLLFGEAFADVGDENVGIFRNKMRGYFGLGHKQNDTWTVELDFILQAFRSNEGEDFNVNDLIFRLRVFKDVWVW